MGLNSPEVLLDKSSAYCLVIRMFLFVSLFYSLLVLHSIGSRLIVMFGKR